MSVIQSKCMHFRIHYTHRHYFSKLNFVKNIKFHNANQCVPRTHKNKHWSEWTTFEEKIGMHWNTRHHWFQRVPIFFTLAQKSPRQTSLAIWLTINFGVTVKQEFHCTSLSQPIFAAAHIMCQVTGNLSDLSADLLGQRAVTTQRRSKIQWLKRKSSVHCDVAGTLDDYRVWNVRGERWIDTSAIVVGPVDFIYHIEVVRHLTLSDITCFRSFQNKANAT